MRVQSSFSILAVIFLFSSTEITLAAAGGGAGGGIPGASGTPMAEDMPPQSPEAIARQNYSSGVRYLEEAAKQEAKLAAAKDSKAASKAQEKITKAYEKALKNFTRAAEELPAMHDAWNYIGFTQRHLGNYKASIAAYAEALALKPNYPEAIEYRGEAFLGLNAIDDAKQAYLSLYRSSRPLADRLLTAMKAWVAKRKENAEGVDGAALDAFARWVDERAAMAAQTASTAGDPPGRW